jgi:DNA-binding transcriptional ArsR family regulator
MRPGTAAPTPSRLRRDVDELDALERQFSPDYDRQRFERPPSRDLLIKTAHERYPDSRQSLPVDGDADVAAAAALIGEPARAALVLALMEEETLPARELAARAGVAPSTASGHLARLVDGGLLSDERNGRHRLFRLADPAVAVALEALSAIAPPRPVRTLREATVSEAIRLARTCYDHLAGRLGVQLSDALERQGSSPVTARATRSGRRRRPASARSASMSSGCRGGVVRSCAPASTGASARRTSPVPWAPPWPTACSSSVGCKRRPTNRSVEVTPRGRVQLRKEFGLDFGA